MENWKRYLDYLRQWIEDHEEYGCVGMSPAYYDEWLNNEAEDEHEDDDICECEWCHDNYEYRELKHTLDGGLICPTCISAIRSRGEKVKIVEG